MVILRNKMLALGLSAAILQTSCGTMLYPERIGQGSGGRLDPTVILLDGIGLLFFLIPGVVAFAIDVTNDTLYLPASAQSTEAPETVRNIQIVDLEVESIEALVYRETGVAGVLSHEQLRVYKGSESQFKAFRTAYLDTARASHH